MPAVLSVFWIKHKKFKKNQKNVKPSHCVMLCDLVSRKNNKLAILQIFLKSVLKRSYHIQGFMAFKPNDQCYGNIHGIVCLTEPISCTHIRLYVANNVAEESFQLYSTKKSFSIFWVPERELFCEACTKNTFQNGTTQFL